MAASVGKRDRRQADLDRDLVFSVLRNDIASAGRLLRAGADANSRAEWDGIKAVDRARERDLDGMANLLEQNGAVYEIPIQELRKGFKWKTPMFEDG